MSQALTITAGRVYRAKKPAAAGTMFAPLVNDRAVTYVCEGFIQYDSPAVKIGGKFKRSTHEAFLKWAGRDVTGELPDGDWAKWPLGSTPVVAKSPAQPAQPAQPAGGEVAP